MATRKAAEVASLASSLLRVAIRRPYLREAIIRTRAKTLLGAAP